MKKLIVILLSLLAVSVWADINPQIDSLRTAAFNQSLIPSGGNNTVSVAYGNLAVNMAIQQVCADFPAIEKFDTVITVAGTRHYALNTDYGQLRAVFKSTKDDDLKNLYTLSFPPVETWFEAKGGEVGGEPDPQKKAEPRYAWSFNDRLYLYPTPSSADSLVIAYYAIDSQIVTATNSTQIRPEYRNPIILYASYLICERKGDFTRSDRYLARYIQMVSGVATKE